MAKAKRKRTKRYTGTDAAQGPVVRRYEAVERGKFGDWRFEHKTRIRIVGIVILVIAVLAFLISGIVTVLR